MNKPEASRKVERLALESGLLHGEAKAGTKRGSCGSLFFFASTAIYISMIEALATYIVSAYDSVEKAWKTLLSTKDKDAAEALKASIEADGVRAKIEAFTPARRE